MTSSVRAWRAIAIAAVVVAFGAAASVAAAATPQVNIVRQGAAPGQGACQHALLQNHPGRRQRLDRGDWVLIEPGVYDEEVGVASAHSGIWIRGMNRNTVIVDGQHKAGNGIEVDKASDVWIENLTVRNFDDERRPAG